MPTLFDSHEEFNEWFSKDIENHAENKSAIDESMLSDYGISLSKNWFISIFFPIITSQSICQDFT